MDLTKFSREDWIQAGVALLLAIDLLFLPWFHIHFSYFGIGFWIAVMPTAALLVIAVRARDAARLAPRLA